MMRPVGEIHEMNTGDDVGDPIACCMLFESRMLALKALSKTCIYSCMLHVSVANLMLV